MPHLLLGQSIKASPVHYTDADSNRQYYPPNINHSRCCDQAICTECFVQIKRAEPTTTHIVSEPAACPYCVQDNFGVVYNPPPWRAGLGSEGSVRFIISHMSYYLIPFFSRAHSGPTHHARRSPAPHPPTNAGRRALERTAPKSSPQVRLTVGSIGRANS